MLQTQLRLAALLPVAADFVAPKFPSFALGEKTMEARAVGANGAAETPAKPVPAAKEATPPKSKDGASLPKKSGGPTRPSSGPAKAKVPPPKPGNASAQSSNNLYLTGGKQPAPKKFTSGSPGLKRPSTAGSSKSPPLRTAAATPSAAKLNSNRPGSAAAAAPTRKVSVATPAKKASAVPAKAKASAKVATVVTSAELRAIEETQLASAAAEEARIAEFNSFPSLLGEAINKKGMKVAELVREWDKNGARPSGSGRRNRARPTWPLSPHRPPPLPRHQPDAATVRPPC